MKPLNLLFLGDSLIDYGDWSQRIPEHRVTSSGVPGETSAELLRRLPGVRAEGMPDVIILMTGTNDLFVATDDFVPIIRSIIVTLRRLFPAAAVILTGLPPFRVPTLTAVLGSLNTALKQLADQTDCYYCDLYQAFTATTKNLFNPDGVHLAEAGYRTWTVEVQTILDRLAFASN